MIKDIKQIIKVLKFQRFSGHVKIGIEHNEVVSTTKDYLFFNITDDDVDLDVNEQLLNFCSITSNGRVEFDFVRGKIKNMTASENKNGSVLRSWLGETCKSVKVVVVKSNILP